MKLALYIKIKDDDSDNCDNECPFIDVDECLLFNEDLEDAELQDGYVLQDDGTADKQRCFKCLCNF